jgi:hypothetical protein
VYSKYRHGKDWLSIEIDLDPNAHQSPCWGAQTNPYAIIGKMLSIFTYPRISFMLSSDYVLSVIFVLTLFGGCSSESKGPKYEIFPPAGGKGAIVVVASGYSGPGLYRDFSSKLAEFGYYTVLMDGKDLFDPGSIGLIVPAENLQTVIAESKSSPQAIPGKVSLVGFSVGGAGVLAYGTKLKDQVLRRGLLSSYYDDRAGHEDLRGRVSNACPTVRR